MTDSNKIVPSNVEIIEDVASSNFSPNQRTRYLAATAIRTLKASALTFENQFLRNERDMSPEDKKLAHMQEIWASFQEVKTKLNALFVTLNEAQKASTIPA